MRPVSDDPFFYLVDQPNALVKICRAVRNQSYHDERMVLDAQNNYPAYAYGTGFRITYIAISGTPAPREICCFPISEYYHDRLASFLDYHLKQNGIKRIG